MMLLTLLTTLLGFSINGNVQDQNQKPVPYASVHITPTDRTVVCDSLGNFTITDLDSGTYVLKISAIGYKPTNVSVSVSSSNVDLGMISLQDDVNQLEEVVIQAIRAGDKDPVTQYNINKEQIQQRYFGHDIPTLITHAPSINSFSDAGNGIGYSGFRMRGMDQTRINMTVNGIPVNDPENQGFFFNNFADLASSTQSIQIQRGVGSSTNGAAAFGGSINLLTNTLSEKPSFGLTTGYGSFNSRRLTAEHNTGLIGGKYAFYGRLSNIHTDGYRRNSGANIQSFMLSGARYGNRSILKFNAFGGLANSELSYSGVSRATLDTNRRFNPLLPSEKDQFGQYFYQLQHTYTLSPHLKLSSSAYYVRGKGWFDVKFNQWYDYNYYNMPNAIVGSDTLSFPSVMTRYHLDQDFLGGFSHLTYSKKRVDMSLGIHANWFRADHYMTTVSASAFPDGYDTGHEVYFNTGYKTDVSTFAKIAYKVTPKLTTFLDVQVRSAGFKYKGKDKAISRDTFSVENMQWNFLNPKAGIRYQLSNWLSTYASIGKTSREPTRLDMFFGEDRAPADIVQNTIKPEEVTDLEIGTQIRTKTLFLNANAYFMEFKNEIVATGQFNAFGYLLRKNAGSSFRRGVEIDATWHVHPKVALLHSSSFSYNRIRSFDQFYTIYDSLGQVSGSINATYKNVPQVLTPSTIVSQGIRIQFFKMLHVELIGKFVEKSFLDNSGNNALTLPSYWFVDTRISADLSKWLKTGSHLLTLQVNNLTNNLYAHNGSVSPFGYAYSVDGNGQLTNTTTPSFFAAATRNLFLTYSLKF